MSAKQKAALRELAKRATFKKKSAVNQSQFLADLFELQRNFINDPATRKALQCSRRAGKTFTALAYLSKACLEGPNRTCLYLAKSRVSAQNVLWTDFKLFSARYDLGIEFLEASLTAVFPNGSRVILSGVKDAVTIERLRGLGRGLVLAIIDETASIPPSLLDNLVTNILTFALFDTKGTLVMMGNPGLLCAGLFFKVTTEPESMDYSVHKWTAYDNPHIPDIAEQIAAEVKRYGWTNSDPAYRREVLNEWVFDADQFVYKYEKIRNSISEIPKEGNWSYVIGCDLGYRDASAFAVLGWRENDPHLYVVESWGESELIPSKVARKLLELRDYYKPLRIVADTGGQGLSIVEEFRQVYGIAIEAAKKTDKVTNIAFLNGDMKAGRIKILSSLHGLIEQMQFLQWKPDTELKPIEDPGSPNDLCDCFNYAYRFARHYLEDVEPEPVKYGTEAYWKIEAQKAREAQIAKYKPKEEDFYDMDMSFED